jgi:hypothetical protein
MEENGKNPVITPPPRLKAHHPGNKKIHPIISPTGYMPPLPDDNAE